MLTVSESLDYLEARAARHGMTTFELLEMTPAQVSDCPQEAAIFWEDKHISHIQPKSVYPEIAHDPSNMMPEDPEPNMSRGAQTMTNAEIEAAHADNQYDATLIDIMNTCDNVPVDLPIPDLLPVLGFF